MRRIEIEVEHRFKNRFVGKHRFSHDDGMRVFGSGRDAHIPLLGEDVDGVHAILESHDGMEWTLADMGSRHGTWVKKKPIVEHSLRSTTVVNIGGHHLKIVPHEINSDLFSELETPSAPSQGNHQFHQVIVRKNGLLVDSILLEKNDNFQFVYEGAVHTFKPPKELDHWHEKKLGDIEVRHRIIYSDRIEEDASEHLKNLIDPELRKPVLGAALLILLVMALFFFMPRKPSTELNELQPEQNKYTSIIFDAKKLKEKRAEAKVLKKNIAGRSKTAPQNPQATGFQNVAAAPKGKGA
ncbi:MAG: FHA domain-containing protein, partial [Bdellovibrionales bacterium]|nr:FHA domain-containing protein [Bdellovibrionales bacterium]